MIRSVCEIWVGVNFENDIVKSLNLPTTYSEEYDEQLDNLVEDFELSYLYKNEERVGWGIIVESYYTSYNVRPFRIDDLEPENNKATRAIAKVLDKLGYNNLKIDTYIHVDFC